MTAITINLLVEEELSKQAQARDPIKLAILIGTVLIGLTAGTGMLLGSKVSQRTQEAAALQATWDKLEIKQPSSSGGDTRSLKTLASDYLAIHHARMLYGPQLALIKDVIPDSIQLVSVRFALVTDLVTPKVEAKPGESEAKAARAAKPKNVERLTLVLDGFTTCARPEIEIDVFIKNLSAEPAFKKYVDGIRLRSIARSGGKTDTDALGLPTVSFSIDCAYKEVSK